MVFTAFVANVDFACVHIEEESVRNSTDPDATAVTTGCIPDVVDVSSIGRAVNNCLLARAFLGVPVKSVSAKLW